MVRFNLDAVLAFPPDVFWALRNSPTFLKFIVDDGLLSHISFGPPVENPDGSASSIQMYRPQNVHCPDLVRNLVGETFFDITDQHVWNDRLRPRHLNFHITPSFLTALSNTHGHLSVEEFPPHKQPKSPVLPPADPPLPKAVSNQTPDPHPIPSTTQCQQSQAPHMSQLSDAFEAVAEREDADVFDNIDDADDDDDVFEDALDCVRHVPPPESDDDTPSGIITPDSEYSAFDDLDQLLDDSPHLPLIFTLPPSRRRPAPAVEDKPVDKNPRQTEDLVSDIDSSSAGTESTTNSDPDLDVIPPPSPEDHIVQPLSDIEAQLAALPPQQKAILSVSGVTKVKILTLGWFVERSIVHNLREFYAAYPATIMRFRHMLYRRFAGGDTSVPVDVVVDRLLRWEAENEREEKRREAANGTAQNDNDPREKTRFTVTYSRLGLKEREASLATDSRCRGSAPLSKQPQDGKPMLVS